MKGIYSIWVTFWLLLTSFGSSAQTIGSAFVYDFNTADQSNIGIRLEGSAFVGSNTLNTKMFTEVLLEPKFSDLSKRTFLGRSQPKVNFFSSYGWNISYVKNTKIGFFLRNNRFQTYTSDKSFAELLLFGNGLFRGKEAFTHNLNFFQGSMYTGGVRYVLLDRKNIKISSSLGLSMLENYAEAKANRVSIYTALDGSFLDVNVSGFALSESDRGIQGVGLAGDIILDYKLNNQNSMSVQALNINGLFLVNSQNLYIDTVFRYTGLPFDAFNSSQSLSNQIDSVYQETINRNKSAKKTTIAPSEFLLKWRTRLNPKNEIILSLQAVSLGRYGYSANTGLIHSFSNRLKMVSSVGYGNFTGFLWREAVEYKLKSYRLYASVNSIQATIIPAQTQNYGVGLGVFKQL